MEIEIKDAVKIINKNVVLDNISLNMRSGNIYGLKGKNGSGKTMLMRAICGMIHLTDGTVKIDDKIISKDITFPENVGVLIENPSFLGSFSGFENLKLLASIKSQISDERIKEVMTEVGLEPDDKKKYRKYSLGMKQKLGIAAAYMENPDLVIMDEPLNALDDESVEKVKDILKNLKKEGKLIIVSCHDNEELQSIADTIIELNSGKVVKIKEKEEKKEEESKEV